MTNKIIIDGEHDMNYCEDSNCKQYGKKEQCEKTHCYYRCYSKLYKQFKRKEQECEDLKNDYAKLEQECEELKAQLKQIKYLYEVQDEKLIDELATENEKYKQALDAIEKLIKEALDPEKTETEQSFDNFYKCLDIINKTREE